MNDITIQELFNRAVRGLRAQGWKQALDEDGTCKYLTSDGKRCGWGWCDPEGTSHNPYGTVHTLRESRIGLAGDLEGEAYWFAQKIQQAHDAEDTPVETMETRFRKLGRDFGITWPQW